MAREVPGKSLKAAFTKGSTNSAPLAFHKHQQHSMNFLSAKSPPAARSGLTSFIDSPRDRLSSASIALFPNMAGSSALCQHTLLAYFAFAACFSRRSDDLQRNQLTRVPVRGSAAINVAPATTHPAGNGGTAFTGPSL